MLAPPNQSAKVIIVVPDIFAVDRIARLAVVTTIPRFALGAAHREVDVAFGQVGGSVIDHADANDAGVTFVGVLVGRVLDKGFPFAVGEDHSAEAAALAGLRSRSAGLTQLIDSDEVRALLAVANEDDLVVELANEATT